MRIAAHVGVKDELDLLPHCIAHLLAIGVDEVLVTDMGSSDGSWEWLEAAASRWPLSLDRMDDRTPGLLAEWPERVGARARACGADWILFLDADEWPLPRDGLLKHCAGLDGADVLVVDRFHVPPGAQGPRMPMGPRPADFPGIPLVVHRVPALEQRLRDDPDAAWILSVPAPKVMVRPSFLGRLAIGGHDIEPATGTSPRRRRPEDLVIAHLPFTTRGRFHSKVDNVAAAVAANAAVFRDRIGWHWRRWIDLRHAGLLDVEFDRQQLDHDSDALPAGSLISAADWFARVASGRRP